MNYQSTESPAKLWNLSNQILYNAMYDANPTKFLAHSSKAIAKFYKGRPLWLYISDDFSTKNIRNFIQNCQNVHSLHLTEMSGIITSQRAAQVCLEFMPTAKYWDIVAMYLPTVISDSNSQNRLVLPTLSHLPIICSWIKNFYKDALLQSLPTQNCERLATALIKGKKIYCLQTPQLTALQAMGMQTPLPNAINRLNLIYVPPESRNKGFAKDIVTLIVNRLQKQGQMPVLYARVDNAPAMQLYKSLGFVEVGRLTELRFI
ncbi:MAG: GNAT family N-acetyltransferase [Firmicutes bacterium]|nr:GNAT family N-acetyltransferase [Bacillota bacterium]